MLYEGTQEPKPSGAFPRRRALHGHVGLETKKNAIQNSQGNVKIHVSVHSFREKVMIFPQMSKKSQSCKILNWPWGLQVGDEFMSAQSACKGAGLCVKLEAPHRHMVIGTAQLSVLSYLVCWGAHGNNKYAA